MSYRARETAAVLTAWSTGQCVSIVGVGSAGKSNFVQHLAASGSVHGPATDWPDNMLPVVIDANMLGPLPDAREQGRGELAFWAGCELLLHRTFMALYPFSDFSDAERTALYQSYEALQDGSNPLYAQLALRYLELGLSVPLRRGQRIAFVLDEFERLATLLPVTFFQSLRGLRDMHKRRLMFATVGRSALPDVMEAAGLPPLASEPFVELFHDHAVYLGAHAPEDAQAMIQDLLGRRNAVMSVAVVGTLVTVTGSFPGLLRASLHAMLDQPAMGRLSARDLTPALLGVPAVVQECAAIWGSLSSFEQAALHELCRGRRADDPAAPAVLQLKGLVTRKSQLQPPIFASFVASGAAS
jgi:hypothetical protein